MLIRHSDDGAEVIRRYEALNISYNGKNFPTRAELARHLAPVVGASTNAIEVRLSRRRSDGAESDIRSRRNALLNISYNGKNFPTRAELARHLAPLVGRSVHAVMWQLAERGDDAATVVELYRRSAEKSQIVVEDLTYSSKAQFIHHLRRRYHVKRGTVKLWLYGADGSPEKALARAKAYARKRSKEPKLGIVPVVLFGWRFRSFSAMRRYYRIPTKNQMATDWWDHLVAGKKPYLFPPLLNGIGRLWENGFLDERNRWPAQHEARMKRSCLPLNDEMEDVEDPDERRLIDALQTPEAPTFRRLALRELDRFLELARG